MDLFGKSSNTNPFLSPQQKEGQSTAFLVNPFATAAAAKSLPPAVAADTAVPTSEDNLQAASHVFQQEQQPKIVFPFIDNTVKNPVNPFVTGSGFPNVFKSQQKKDEEVHLYALNQDSGQANIYPWKKSAAEEKPLFLQQNPEVSANPFSKKPVGLISKTISNVDFVDKTDQGSTHAIQLHGIPNKYFAKEFLMSFYSQFGTVVNIELKSFPTKTAVVKFLNRDNALKAMGEGQIFEDGEPPIKITLKTLPISSNLPKQGTFNKQRLQSKKIMKKPRQSLDDFKVILRSYAQSLSNVCCSTSREKYELLDKLDKKIREGLQRDSKEYKALVGTCLEMCPEKERYFRDDKCQCSIFETSESDNAQGIGDPESVLDPLRAVKEYSRSSADQEVPLPHELRHISALKQTMDYLVWNIVTEKYSSVPEWFDFLWNRTRAIRKDITQQNLKCTTSIDCVEKCARFHIFCTHYLCEQEMHIFDAKINLENLTKCLQTLKHMYADFFSDHQTTCPNEAEFRGYQILLNLNNGDTLREVMGFSEEVRKSTPVKFASEVFSAVQENNYSRFFKLLKKSSFLSACLMHPYFTQIRAVALKRMARAFSVPKTDTPYPIQTIQEIFMFDDMETAADFCVHFGFETDNFDVFLNRTSYNNPDEHFAKQQSDIINMKCEISMAEVINGGSLSTPVNYHPVNSFTSDGYYIGSYQELEGVPDYLGVGDAEMIQPTPAAEAREDPDYIVIENDGAQGEEEEEDFTKDVDYADGAIVKESERPVMILREDVTNFSLVLVDELLLDVTNSTFNEIMQQFKETLGEAEPHANLLIAEFCVHETASLAKEIMDEAKDERNREEAEVKKSVTDQMCSSYVDESVKMLLEDICFQVYSESRKTKDAAMIQREAEALQRFLVDSTLVEFVCDIAVDAHRSVSLEKKQSLMSRKEQLETRMLHRYFQRWIKSYKYHIFVKTTLAEFPQAPPSLTTREAIERLILRDHDEAPQHLDICADVSWLDNERNFKKKLTAFHKRYEELRVALSAPIRLKGIFEKTVIDFPQHHHTKKNATASSTRNKFCRIRIAVPTQNRQRTGQTILTPDILVNKFSNISAAELTEILQGHKDRIIYRDCINCNNRSFVHTSVRVMQSGSPVRNTMLATSCLIFVVHLHNNNSREHWQNEHRRLNNILKTSSQQNHPILLVIGIADDDTHGGAERIAAELYLDNFKMDNVVCDYHCVVLNDDIKSKDDVDCLNNELENAMERVLSNCELRGERIISKQLSSFVEDGMTKLFFNTFQRYCLHCKKIGLPIPNPIDVVRFYNNSIEEVANAIFDFSFNANEDTQDEEFYTEGVFDGRTRGTYDLVMKLKLPDFTEDYSRSDHENCVSYIQLLGGAESEGLVNRVNTVLQQYRNTTRRHFDTDVFPWADVLELCIVHALGVMYVKLPQVPAAFTAHVHYQESIWESVTVVNPLKQHMNSFNVSLRCFNESGFGTHLKRRKYEREYNLRDSIETTSDELSSIEDSMRKRKARRLSQEQSSPLQDIINDSMTLVQGIHSVKKTQFRDRLSFSPIEKYPSLVKTSPVSSYKSPKFDESTEKLLQQSVALEDSLVDCLKQIDDANLEWRSRKEYWESVINH